MDAADVAHLRRCIELAREARELGDEPFGSLLVGPDGAVLAEERNAAVTLQDVTAHPELMLARWASQHLGPQERAASTMYTSCEHCAMCAAGHHWAGIGRLVFALSGEQLIAMLPPGLPELRLLVAGGVRTGIEPRDGGGSVPRARGRGEGVVRGLLDLSTGGPPRGRARALLVRQPGAVTIRHLPATAPAEEVATALAADGVCVVDHVVERSVLDQVADEMAPYFEATRTGPDDFSGHNTRRTGGAHRPVA